VSRRAPGLRERKKARLRQQIIETAVRLFRKRGYENTRVEDIVQILEISQPTFFRYFPSKDAVLREVGRRGFACQTEKLESEIASKATTADRLRRFYQELAQITEADRPLWQAVVLRQILAQGQKRGEIVREFPVAHLAEFMEGLFTTVVRRWAVDLTGPHDLRERVSSAVEFFLRGARA
jgi:AcrR family transcriptional regulator